MKTRLHLALRVLLLCAVVLGACSLGQKSNYVDDRFLETYHDLQWNDKYILGEPLSHIIVDPELNIERQYFENGILVYNPDVTPRFYLEPVGQLLSEGAPEPIDLDSSASPNIKGYRTIEAFLSAYETIGGERWFGNPITHVYQAADGLYRQDFESLGFYRYESDPPGAVRFLPYGTWRQQQINQVELEGIASPDIKSDPPLTVETGSTPELDLEQKALDELGPDFLGNTLSTVYPGQDGRQEIVFENVVVYDDPLEGAGFSLRPIGHFLHTSSMARGKERTGWIFRALDGKKGYMIPDYFDSFIQENGGYSLSGEPISQLVLKKNRVREQCFENLCLRYKQDQQEITLIPLGMIYKASLDDAQLVTPQAQPTLPTSPTPEQEEESPITLNVWHFHAQISPKEKQEIGTCVFRDETPLSEYSAELTVFLPENRQVSYQIDEPDEGGCVYFKLKKIDADNGQVIHYRVCAAVEGLDPLCEAGYFLIWGNP